MSLEKGDCFYLKLIKEVEDYINKKLMNVFESEKSEISKKINLSNEEKEMLIAKHEKFRIHVDTIPHIEKSRTHFYRNKYAAIYMQEGISDQEHLFYIAHEVAHILQCFDFFDEHQIDEAQASMFAHQILTIRNKKK